MNSHFIVNLHLELYLFNFTEYSVLEKNPETKVIRVQLEMEFVEI